MTLKETRLTSSTALLLVLLTGGLVLPVFSVSAADPDDSYQLSIRPSICVSYDNEAPCEMMLNISWRGGNGAPVCLNTAAEPSPISCWENTLSGELEVPYAQNTNSVYQLVDREDNRVLADAEVQVISRDLRDSRQRRRHVWSIL